ncbi:MAG: oxidoreductase, partial [Burkholderiales bacterium PBB4]
MLTFLQYEQTEKIEARSIINSKIGTKTKDSSVIRLALIGAGGFAKGMHLPNIQSLPNQFQLTAVMSRTGHNAIATAKRYGAQISTTDYNDILNNPDIDAVIIATRHSLHAEMALAALNAGKHVLLEKPLALNANELSEIEKFYSNGFEDKPVLMVGFNRRFSKYSQEIFSSIQNRSNPMNINYQMNAGYIPLDHWVHTEEGGGR